MKSTIKFPDTFLWGCSTAAGDIACDPYNRYRSDVQLMSELGLQSYMRFHIRAIYNAIADG